MDFINSSQDCEHVALNFIASEYSGNGPILLPPKYNNLVVKKAPEGKVGKFYRDDESRENYILDRCINNLARTLGKNTLVKNRFRLDPLLYKDQVTNLEQAPFFGTAFKTAFKAVF